jgi:histidine ammonia-lyase
VANTEPVFIGVPMTVGDVVRVARDNVPVKLHEEARHKVAQSRAYVEHILAKHKTVYGITTGFGKLATVRVSPSDTQLLQRNLILSHAMGVGEPLGREVVRAMLLLRAQSLAFGHSGIRPQIIDLIVSCLNQGVHPVVPSQGSVGASGDLAPLAHMSLLLLGEGKAEYQGVVMTAAEALDRAGLNAVTLEAKEGLALINGTQAMTALGALVLHDAQTLATCADIAGAMSLEALKGTLSAFDEKVLLPTCVVWVRIVPFTNPTKTAKKFRMPIRCAVCPKFTGRVVTRYDTRSRSSRLKSTA